jgi:ADP-ribose pyrophosphatase YjhB (NUDIX family)
MSQAISRAIAEEMRADPTVVLWGEDVGPAGGVFKVTAGLHDEFGDRVRDTPISEMGFLGAAAGAAATGLRPVVEIMFIEFAGVALDQIVTEAALFHYLSAGKYRVPMTIRASAGAGLGFGAQHSQTLERWFIGTPGLKVVVASGARSAYQLTRAAIRDDGPVVVLEPRSLYATREEFEFIERYKTPYKALPYPPVFVTVDAVVVQSGHVLLVERRARPGKGLMALPGGFIGADEKIEDAVIRELREETRLKVPDPVLRGSLIESRVFDDPHRSARGRTITHAFYFRLKDAIDLPNVKGGDDAKSAQWYPIGELQRELFFEDHYSIITKMIGTH